MPIELDPPRPGRTAAQASTEGATVVDPAPLDAFGTAWGSRRVRVLLVRIPPDAQRRVEAALPRRRDIRPEKLPFVVRITADREVAIETARRLREAGGVVVIVEEPGSPEASGFCTTHTSRLSVAFCIKCGTPTCIGCRDEAQGEEICPRCLAAGRSPRRRIRLRQLFVIFLFAVFVFEVVQYLRRDRELVDPRGPVDVVVLQFASRTGLSSTVLRELNTPHEGAGRSLHDISAWYNGERARYGGLHDYLRVTVRGPWPRLVTPPDMESAHTLLQSAWLSWKYKRYFDGLATDQGVSQGDFGVRVFVLYGTDDSDLASESRASEKGRLAISWVGLDEGNAAYAVLTVAHEIAHTLGARDTYDPKTSLSEYPAGYVEPFADPLYPQRYAELMSGDVPLSPGAEREVRSLSEVRIGYRTAADMAWIGREQADFFYTPPALQPADLLPPRDTAAGPPRALP